MRRIGWLSVIATIVFAILIAGPAIHVQYWSRRTLIGIDTPTQSFDMAEIYKCVGEVNRFGSLRPILPEIIGRCRSERLSTRLQALYLLCSLREEWEYIHNELDNLSNDPTLSPRVRTDLSDAAHLINATILEEHGAEW